MAATDSQKQLLTLIRDFASEKSQGERRVFSLKKRIEELRSELDVANGELENSKRLKETTEQELKGYEVESSMSETSIQTLETRSASIQDGISKIGSDVDALKTKESVLREEFICQMVELKTRIREFQKFAIPNLQQKSMRTSLERNPTSSEDAEFVCLKEKVSFIVAQTVTEEQEREREENLQNQLHGELVVFKRRLELVEAIMNDIKELLDFTRQTSELEEKCASFSEELQNKCMCPTCHLDNSEALAELLQEMEHY